ncbi:helix-turn-helix domain-containing protein [Actinophytocola sediminis]
MESAVSRVIAQMWARYFEPITLQDLAASVFVSPFHFLRVFARTTGVTPGRYLSAVRMFEAKRLLLTTSLTVSDIVCSVGYSSVGTFTTRFTQLVGLTPSRYREPDVGARLVALGPGLAHLPAPSAIPPAVHSGWTGGGSVLATVEVPPAAAPADVFVGVFRDAVPQCAPVAHELVHRVGSSRIAVRDVPPGRWTVIAVARPRSGGSLLCRHGPVTVTQGGTVRVPVRLRSPEPTDPPLAISLAPRSAQEATPVVPVARTLRAVA